MINYQSPVTTEGRSGQFVLWQSPVSDLTFAAVSLGAPHLTRLLVKV